MARRSPTLPADRKEARRDERREERLQRREQQRAQQQRADLRRKILLGALGVLALIGVAAYVLTRPAAIQSPGHEVAIEGVRQHIPDGEPIVYKNRPPSSGNHYGNPSGYGVFQRAIPAGNFVHTLEHGGVVVLYRPDLCDDACRAQLQALYNAAPESTSFHTRKLAIIPYEQMDHAIAGLAWGWIDEMDQVNADELMTFYRAHLDQGPEQAL